LALTITLPAFANIASTESIPFEQIQKEQTRVILESSSKKVVDERYYTISSIEVRELTESVWRRESAEKTEDAEEVEQKDPIEETGKIVDLIDKIIAVGKKVWDIVAAGKPVVQTDMDLVIRVLPRTELDGAAFYEMENWGIPKFKDYEVVFKNAFGKSVVSFTYTVLYQAGGTFEGTGKYLTGVNVTATNVYVAWGFNFNAKSALVGISNHGSKGNPEAGATLQVKYTVENVLNHISATETVHVMGRGEIHKIR
jgi:hypothetical protein